MTPSEFDSDLHPTPLSDTWPEPSQPTPDSRPSVGGFSWIGLIVFGVFMIIGGAIVLVNSQPDESSWYPSEEPTAEFRVLAGVFIIGGILAILASPLLRRSEIEANIQKELRLEEQRAEEERLREEERDDIVRAVKSTIKIRCRYCGTLNEEKATRCESCGGSL
jgi:MFS family permease